MHAHGAHACTWHMARGDVHTHGGACICRPGRAYRLGMDIAWLVEQHVHGAWGMGMCMGMERTVGDVHCLARRVASQWYLMNACMPWHACTWGACIHTGGICVHMGGMHACTWGACVRVHMGHMHAHGLACVRCGVALPDECMHMGGHACYMHALCEPRWGVRGHWATSLPST